jgi:hypothetical protein
MSEPPTALMVATVFFGPAALIAALFLLVRDVAPALSALARGRIRSRGHGGRLVERRAEPDRFHAMVKRRLMVGGGGFLFCLAAGAILIARNVRLDQLMS